jgi:prophage antirepressor-like protein
MNELMVFQNPEFGELRTAERNGETWFCLADICRPLGLMTKDVRERLKEDRVVTIPHTDRMGRPKNMVFVNEGNLYRAIFQSRKPEAERFTDWVTSEVLPSIRKTGGYTAKPMTLTENVAAQAQILLAQEQRLTRIEQRVETALTAIARPGGDTWVEDMKAAIAGYCKASGLMDTAGRGRLYEMLEREARCDTNARLRCLRQRRKEAGDRYKDYMALTKLDAIALDRKLRVAFEGVVARETARAVKK